MYNGTRAHLASDRGHVLPILGRRGVSVAAIAGIDMALWEILGKSRNAPIWRLLGGRRREKMPAYASGGWAPVDGLGAELKSFIDRGNFRAVKMRVGSGDGELSHSVASVHDARELLGPDTAPMSDAHGTFCLLHANPPCRHAAAYD